MVTTTAPGGLMGWIQTYGGYIQFVVMVIYYLVLCVAAVWATLLFRRLVNYKTAPKEETATAPVAPAVTAASPVPEMPAAPAGPRVSVDEFVD